MTLPPPPQKHSATAILIAVMIMIGASAAVGIVLVARAPEGSGTGADGPTLYQSLAAVNASVVGAPGGPWLLFSFYGVAAEAPFSANVLPYGNSVNRTVNGCESAFDGLTLWNGSIPTFDGDLSSGTAPFWQFAYYSNASQELLLTTDVLGAVRVFPPVPISGSCQPWYDIDEPTPSYWTDELAQFPVNSPRAARTAIQSMGDEVQSAGSAWVEIFSTGPGMVGPLGDAPGRLAVYLDRCGEVDVSGLQPLVAVTEDLGGGYLGSANLNESCAVLSSGHGVYDGSYSFRASAPEITSGPGSQWFAVRFQVALAYPNGTLTGDYDGWGLANWMVNLDLTNRTGSTLPLAPASCSGWRPSVADCPAEAGGWFAIILSGSGAWTNALGEGAGGQVSWSVPVTALVSDQQLVIVIPSEWSSAGDTLTLNSAVSTSSVEGTIGL